MEKSHVEVGELGGAQTLGLLSRRPRLQLLGLLHQWADDKGLATLAQPLATFVIASEVEGSTRSDFFLLARSQIHRFALIPVRRDKPARCCE